ncbi:hypothetical protein [Roseomonas genomospecies 6]|uniref:Uncharacterized protein n=1 Tax=Roseomonas genomospecies 6 TaxID=214106 RepID=A0A9W7KRD5_9PROT|nr:hypothetical protein [Roseomonas genomospecies 6]KAA0678253.1 hypothetical protein DS843_20585 [Roseomonas genomospecies 6]
MTLPSFERPRLSIVARLGLDERNVAEEFEPTPVAKPIHTSPVHLFQDGDRDGLGEVSGRIFGAILLRIPSPQFSGLGIAHSRQELRHHSHNADEQVKPDPCRMLPLPPGVRNVIDV